MTEIIFYHTSFGTITIQAEAVPRQAERVSFRGSTALYVVTEVAYQVFQPPYREKIIAHVTLGTVL